MQNMIGAQAACSSKNGLRNDVEIFVNNGYWRIVRKIYGGE